MLLILAESPRVVLRHAIATARCRLHARSAYATQARTTPDDTRENVGGEQVVHRERAGEEPCTALFTSHNTRRNGSTARRMR